MNSRDDLFRPQAVKAQRVTWLGEIMLIRPMSFTAISFATLAIALAFIAFLCLGSYTSKTVVDGQLAPVGGILKLHAPQPAVVVSRRISEGASVVKGQVLYTLSAERQSSTDGRVDTKLIEQIRMRRDSLERQLAETQQLQVRQTQDLEQQIAALEQENERFGLDVETANKRVDIAKEVFGRYQSLAEKNYISTDQLQSKNAELVDASQRLQSVQRDRTTLAREIMTRRHDLAEMTLKQKTDIDAINREVVTLNGQLTEGEAKRDIAIVAPVDGVVESVLAEAGQYVDPSRPLATVVAKGTALVAYLYVPNRSVGFTKVGDKVMLRFPAYPYQKFGQYRGEIASISKVAVSPTELENIAGGIPGLDATRATDLYYQVTVKMNSQEVQAYGKSWPLAAGMAIEASIERDTRKLYEWALDPLMSLRGRISA